MKLIEGDQLKTRIDSIIHLPTQQREHQIDLTVENIYSNVRSGTLDFGGSELQSAESKRLEPQKKNKDDDYGWWELSEGHYRVILNEELKINDSSNELAVLTLHPHGRQASLSAPTQVLPISEEPDLQMNISVPSIGCNIKENARIATLFILEE